MATTQQPSNTPAPVPSQKTVFLLLRTLADTTLRLFVPVLTGLFIGLWIDGQNKTKPLATIVCVLVGIILSILLIYLQVKAIDKEKT